MPWKPLLVRALLIRALLVKPRMPSSMHGVALSFRHTDAHAGACARTHVCTQTCVYTLLPAACACPGPPLGRGAAQGSGSGAASHFQGRPRSYTS